MACTLSSGKTVDIEDLCGFAEKKPFNYKQNPYKMIKIVDELLSHNFTINDKKKVNKFIKEMWSKHSESFGGSQLLYTYRSLCDNGIYEYDSKYEKLLRVKSSKSKPGIISVTLVTSPFPGIDFTKDNTILLRELIENGTITIDQVNDLYPDTAFEDIDPLDVMTRLDDNGTTIAGAFSCEYNCNFCPKEPGQPRSYLTKEPAVMRARRNRYDPILQSNDRIGTLYNNGHPIDKIELLVLGGTWSSYDKKYRDDFINKIYYAANIFFVDKENIPEMKSIKEERMNNKTSICHIIGMTLETRPDKINVDELKTFRNYGVTRVQLGVQTSHDSILNRINRKCSNATFLKAAKLLKRSGFKFDIHIMPDLPHPLKPGVSPFKRPRVPDDIDWSVDMVIKDLEMFYLFIFDPDYQADQWKIYPCETVPWTEIKEEYETGTYKPYTDKNYSKEELEMKYHISTFPDIDFNNPVENLTQEKFVNNFMSFMKHYVHVKENLNEKPLNKRERLRLKRQGKTKRDPVTYNLLFMLIIYVKIHVRRWVRLNRVIRDIPELYHIAGVKQSNTRQLLHNDMKDCGFECQCIRCMQISDEVATKENTELQVFTYNASDGIEKFICYLMKDTKKLVGFVRLRLDKFSGYDLKGNVVFEDHHDSAMIRELHVYGQVVRVSNKKKDVSQHKGFGTALMHAAMKIARDNGYKKMSVIAGDGVVGYYEKFDFKHGEYFLVTNLIEYINKHNRDIMIKTIRKKVYKLRYMIVIILILLVYFFIRKIFEF
jgi:histone acetyltransferase (RNA polymerase elongator complex component)